MCKLNKKKELMIINNHMFVLLGKNEGVGAKKTTIVVVQVDEEEDFVL